MDILIGCKPTGHYWFTFAKCAKEHGMKLALVNPCHIKQSKEMNGNSPRKPDQKGPKTITNLVRVDTHFHMSRKKSMQN